MKEIIIHLILVGFSLDVVLMRLNRVTIINLSLTIWGARDHKTPLGGSQDPIAQQFNCHHMAKSHMQRAEVEKKEILPF